MKRNNKGRSKNHESMKYNQPNRVELERPDENDENLNLGVIFPPELNRSAPGNI